MPAANDPPSADLLTERQAGEILSIKPWAVHNRALKGKLPCVQTMGRWGVEVLIPKADLERWMAQEPAKREPRMISCARCGREIPLTMPWRRFCSNKCKEAERTAKRKQARARLHRAESQPETGGERKEG